MGGGSGETKKPAAALTLDDSEAALHAHLQTFFKDRNAAQNLADLAQRDTLGQGTFGRVRLAHSAEASESASEVGMAHPGYFALKILKKSEIIRLKQLEHVASERALLLNKTNHPFVVKAYHTYKDERNLYMILEYVPGGELLSMARGNASCFANDTAKFYAAQLVMALQYLHADNIIYRGMVPDNLLIDRQGYIKLVDFGFAKQFPPSTGEEQKTYTLCGTAEYLAPEIVNSKGHGKGADWWALGIVIFEMLAGYPPFFADNPFEIYQKILKAQPKYPGHFDVNLYEGVNRETGLPLPDTPKNGLIVRLLRAERTHRIGCLKNGAEDIKKHKWFRGLNWAALYNKQLPPPPGALTPELRDDDDRRYFAKYPDSVEESGPLLEAKKQELFDYWA
jgi:protein kinase X